MTHQSAEPSTASHAPPVVAALAALLLVVTLLAPLVIVLRCSWASRRALRSCPLCGSSAIRDGSSQNLNFIEARVWLQCGQCGTSRRLVANLTDQHAHQRRIKRDRRGIRDQMRRLETERRWFDMRTFIALLWSDIVGADDFLACTRPPAPARQRRPERRPGDR